MIEDLKKRVAELEDAEHEAIFALGMATGRKDEAKQILNWAISPKPDKAQDDEDGETEQ